jgi:hypothetical protein
MVFVTVEAETDNLFGKVRRYLRLVQETEGRKRAERVQKAARLDCGFVTGALAASIKVWKIASTTSENARNEVWTVGSDLSYALVVHNGVLHDYFIVGHRGKLRFIGADGTVVFRKSVVHGPITGKFYLSKNLWRAVT